MSLSALGKNTFPIEVTHVSTYGVWLLLVTASCSCPMKTFRGSKTCRWKNSKCTKTAPGHFYWPDLDVDLSEEIIAHPERFPLKAK